jgi:hypothetical protein
VQLAQLVESGPSEHRLSVKEIEVLRAVHRADQPESRRMNDDRRDLDLFTAPWLLASAVLVFAVALIEKGLNLIGTSLPFTQVFPSQLLGWAVTLLIFDIALTLRHLLELQRRSGPSNIGTAP